jgi:hypothetical protein
MVSATTLRWRLPQPRSGSVVVGYRGGFLLMGGLGNGDRSTADVLRAPTSGGPVRHAGHLSEALHDSAGGLLAGRPTTFGGGAATELADIQTRGPGGTFHVAGRLPGARSDLAVAPSPSGLLVIGGYDGSHSPRAVLSTEDGRHFRRVGRLPYGVRYAGVAEQGGTIWLVGGESNGRELDEVWQLDAASGRVRTRGHLPRPVGHEALAVVGGRLLVIGGRTRPDRVTDAMWWYRPGTRHWTSAGRLPRPVADAAWVRRGNQLFLFGGETPAFTARTTRVSWTG